jgi:hypothetical protein
MCGAQLGGMMMMFQQDSTDAPPTTPLGASPTGSPSGVSLLLYLYR